MSSENNSSSSTAKAYMDQATGYIESTVGSLTGNSSQQTRGESTRAQGDAENTASHTTARMGPISADPNTGAVAKDDPNRTTGSWDQTVGSAKEALGNLVGSESLRQQGARQNADGKAQEARGQLQDWGQGVSDRAEGAVKSVGAAVLGDRAEEDKWREVHDEGKVRQRGAEADMEKKAAY